METDKQLLAEVRQRIERLSNVIDKLGDFGNPDAGTSKDNAAHVLRLERDVALGEVLDLLHKI